VMFQAVFSWAQAPMDWIEAGMALLGGLVAAHMPAGPVADLLVQGVIGGAGTVLVFLPQIIILFLFILALEDSGYLPRAAFLLDRVMASVGLTGRSFIPLLSSFACAIPGIMATRTIEDRKSRLATILIAPFMSCSARLPVYTLLIGTFFATAGAFAQAGIMLALYALGIVAAAGTAWLFKRSLLRGPTPAFILELPTYKVPQATQVARQVFNNTWSFLAKAGTTIFCLSIILWAMTYYPRMSPSAVATTTSQAKAAFAQDYAAQPHDQQTLSPQEYTKAEGEAVDKAVGADQIRHSVAGRIGHAMEPALKPLGYDWKMGVGLVGAFAAREVFVSTMGIIYSVGDPGEETADLSKVMRADTYPNGKPVWSPLVAVSLLVWFVLAMQCMSTLAIVRRETGGWRWPLFMLLYMNALAYVVALGVYQIGKIWFV